MTEKQLFPTAIYVNRAPKTLRKVSHGKAASAPLTEGKLWREGERLLAKATADGCELALIFGYYKLPEYWAVAREIAVEEGNDSGPITRYRFADLHKLRSRERKDLTVLSTGKPLPNTFIRSYAIVQTPDFLMSGPAAGERILESPPRSFAGLSQGKRSSIGFFSN